jgi:HKD family nuclease
MADFVYQDRIFRARTERTLRGLADHTVTGVRIAVAYTTRSGVRSLVNSLKPRLGAAWVSATKVLITSFDFYLTEPDALDMARKAGFQVYRGWTSGFAFHPKLYVLDTAAGDTRLLVGSANLTAPALAENTELGVALRLGAGTPEQRALNVTWDRLLDTAQFLDEVDIARYRHERTRNAPKRRPTPRRPRAPQPPPLGTLPSFQDEVLANRLRPQHFRRFWIQAGAMSSSASHNQLELPRFANHFFGFSFSAHATTRQRHVIGTVRVVVLGVEAIAPRDQELQWRGRGVKKMNQMERLYLPTVKQGGLDYAHTAILFTRVRRRVVHVLVVPWAGAVAHGWRRTSASAGNLFALGGRSTRICGLL